jgi:ABC-type enterobactin transport system permease subunit
MSISRWIVAVADSILLAAAVLTLIAAPVVFVALSAPDNWAPVASPLRLNQRVDQAEATVASCRCTYGDLAAELPVRWARRRPDGTP